MKQVEVLLPTPEIVQQFVETLTALPGDFTLVDGNFMLDAKSLMGIFTFDLTKPLRLDISDPTPQTLAALKAYTAGKGKDTHE